MFLYFVQKESYETRRETVLAQLDRLISYDQKVAQEEASAAHRKVVAYYSQGSSIRAASAYIIHELLDSSSKIWEGSPYMGANAEAPSRYTPNELSQYFKDTHKGGTIPNYIRYLQRMKVTVDVTEDPEAPSLSQQAASQQEGEQSTTPRPAGTDASGEKKRRAARYVTQEDKNKGDLVVGYIKAYCIGAATDNKRLKDARIKAICDSKKVAFANTVDALPLVLFVKHVPTTTAGTSTARNGLSPTTLQEHAISLCKEFFEKTNEVESLEDWTSIMPKKDPPPAPAEQSADEPPQPLTTAIFVQTGNWLHENSTLRVDQRIRRLLEAVESPDMWCTNIYMEDGDGVTLVWEDMEDHLCVEEATNGDMMKVFLPRTAPAGNEEATSKSRCTLPTLMRRIFKLVIRLLGIDAPEWYQALLTCKLLLKHLIESGRYRFRLRRALYCDKEGRVFGQVMVSLKPAEGASKEQPPVEVSLETLLLASRTVYPMPSTMYLASVEEINFNWELVGLAKRLGGVNAISLEDQSTVEVAMAAKWKAMCDADAVEHCFDGFFDHLQQVGKTPTTAEEFMHALGNWPTLGLTLDSLSPDLMQNNTRMLDTNRLFTALGYGAADTTTTGTLDKYSWWRHPCDSVQLVQMKEMIWGPAYLAKKMMSGRSK